MIPVNEHAVARRIVPCLDVRDGQVVKGIQFRNHVVMGDIIELAANYRDQGADELVFYDITASPEGRRVDIDWVRRVSETIDIPFCVAGGIRSVKAAAEVLAQGADKISINTPALERPALINELVAAFGSQCVVIGVDSLATANGFSVRSHTGNPDAMRNPGRRTLDWLTEVVDRGAGEVVLNCMSADGTRSGYDIAQLAAARAILPIPLVASGGAGQYSHFIDVFKQADVDAALAASVFHSGQVAIPDLKKQLADANIEVKNMLITTDSDISSLAWSKMNDLIPAIVQDDYSGCVLMQGFMNPAAMQATLDTGKVTFWSRSQEALWTKGETSEYLELSSIHTDCDNDSLLILAQPCGPTCHTGSNSCFDRETQVLPELAFLDSLEQLIEQRQTEMPINSYTTDLFTAGTKRIAQKVGEEGLETALAAVAGDDSELLNESADLLFHLLVLLSKRKLKLADVIATLKSRQG